MLLIDKITSRENWYWAWEKLKFAYKSGDVWYNQLELAAFEADLERHFSVLTADIQSGTFQLSPLCPIGYPKANSKLMNDNRQMFAITVRDQLCWIAVVNIIGSTLDREMPFWSYGHRLYIPAFYDQAADGKKQLKFGWYRNTSGYIYRKWHQSWPLFRKHVALTIKRFGKQALTEKETEEVRITSEIIPTYNQLKCQYILEEFWHESNLSKEIYWASIDFQKFYPTARIEVILNNILFFLPAEEMDNRFRQLVTALCSFKIDLTGWSSEELEKIGLSVDNVSYQNIPTGLFVAGFLANVLLLRVDKQVHEVIIRNRNIAHFRFVDDHVILADSFQNLVNWIKWYQELLGEFDCGAVINMSKTEPEELQDLLFESASDDKQAQEACKLDALFPSPLMTQTLAKISAINETDFELLSDNDKERFIDDIEHLLLADFNDEEIKKDTRLSFAATVLTRVLPKKNIYKPELTILEQSLIKNSRELKQLENVGGSSSEINSVRQIIEDLLIEKARLQQEVEDQYHREFYRVMQLLAKVIYENYDKVRLWNRALDFCLASGYQGGIKCVFDLLRKLNQNNKASDLSIGYIQALNLNTISALVFKAYRIIRENDYTIMEKERAYRFLNEAVQWSSYVLPAYLEQKSYYASSISLLKNSIQILFFSIVDNSSSNLQLTLLKQNPVKEYFQGLDNLFEEKSITQKVGLIWHFSKLIHSNFEFQPRFWQEAIRFLKQEFTSLFFIYPSHLPIHLFVELQLQNINEGLVFEFLKSHPSILTPKDKLLIINKDISEKNTLWVWNDHLKKIERSLVKRSIDNQQIYFDPRLSEWTSLEIIDQIISIVSDYNANLFSTNEESNYIHPLNYIVPEKWFSLENNNISWHDWTALMQSERISFRIGPHIFDERFTPIKSDQYGVIDDLTEEPLLQGLGTMLICLLTKDFMLPPGWNLAGHQRLWLNAILQKLQGVSISSLTKQILLSIFSKRNRENKYLKLFFSIPTYEFQEDTLLDPEPIEDLRQLKVLVKNAKLILERYQLNVQDNQARQLIPVSLQQLTKEYNPYAEQDANNLD
jgi:hypothetical protein